MCQLVETELEKAKRVPNSLMFEIITSQLLLPTKYLTLPHNKISQHFHKKTTKQEIKKDIYLPPSDNISTSPLLYIEVLTLDFDVPIKLQG